MEKRQLVLAGRLLAAGLAVFGRGAVRSAGWAGHDFLWLYPTLRRNGDWHGPVVTRFHTQEREVWLTIDDGPDERDTPAILDLLGQHGALATFFVIGRRAEKHPELCRRIADAGHGLANHTYSHPAGLWWALPRPWVRREMQAGNQAIENASGYRPSLFRSPVGMNSFAVHPVADSLNLRVIGWSAEGCDGCPGAPTAIANRIMRAVRPGTIILIHESGFTKHRALTLSRLLDRLAQGGYRCVLPQAAAFCSS